LTGKLRSMHGFDADVAIAGAGPAGSAAAFTLARAGLRVVVIDSHEFPRDKACGDLLGTDAVATLERFGLREATLAGALPLVGAVLHGPHGARAGALGHAVRAERRADARVLPRRLFDARLLACAREAGAEFVRGRVTSVLRSKDGRVTGVSTSTGDVRAKATIGAEGWGSPVARALGAAPPAPGYAALTVRAYAARTSELERRMHFFINPSGEGYAWIFPLPEGRANIGLGFITGEAGSGGAADAFERFFGPASLAQRFLLNGPRAEPLAWPIPLGWRDGRYAVPGALLAGDAARLASPLSGSGIYNALASGSGAARYVQRALRGDEAAWIDYGAWLRRRFAGRLRIERWIHNAVGTPKRVEPWLALAGAVPGAGAALSHALLALG